VVILASVVFMGPVFEADDEEIVGPSNLQVLPCSWSNAEVEGVMGSFQRSLSVPCGHCHSQAVDSGAHTYAADGNDHKARAREMLEMLPGADAQLARYDVRSLALVELWCESCHRGRPTPVVPEKNARPQIVRKPTPDPTVAGSGNEKNIPPIHRVS
jgi:hypothetical protein